MKKKIFFSLLIFALIPTFFGFQSINHKDFFVLFNHKIGESYKRIELLNKKSNLAKLGKEEVAGKISGKIYYHAKVSGLGGLVTIRYENFSDEEGWVFNGEIITKANIKGNGNFVVLSFHFVNRNKTSVGKYQHKTCANCKRHHN